MENKIAFKESKMALEAPLVVSKIFDNCLYSGFFGRLDSERIKVVTERILEQIENDDFDYIIIDLSNLDLIDTAVAAHLIKIGKTLKFTGIEVILCGIKGIVAQTMSVIDIELNTLKITKDLMKALNLVYQMSGYQLIKKN